MTIHFLSHHLSESECAIFAKIQSLKNLSESNFDFYLGGSRRMSDLCLTPKQHPNKTALIFVNQHTDYDLYATWSFEIENYLLNQNFEIKPHPDIYLDDEAIKVLSHKNEPVQVVLRKDAVFYKNVFESIDTWFFYNYLWKSSTVSPDPINIRQIFNMLFDIAKSNQK